MYAFRLVITVSFPIFILHGNAGAQVSTDGTAGERRALSGPDYRIDADLGTVAGDNLFHSFEAFSIDTGESATFAGPAAVDDVIARVTGGELSAIDGLIASTIPGASLWLFNPAGVVFGPNASLDVPGSFHVSTADELRLADGATFSAIDPDSNSFSVAEPEAFGFLGADPAGITIAGSQLEVGEGETLSVVGGDVEITGGTLMAGNGGLNVLAADGPADADVITGELSGDVGGDIEVAASALTATGDGGGTVRIEGGAFVVDEGSAVRSTNDGANDADVGIDVDVEVVEITGGSSLDSRALDRGAGGSIMIEADTIDLLDGARIGSAADGSGNGGDIALISEDIDIEGADGIANFTSAEGDGGSIDIDTENLTLIDATIGAGTQDTASGDGGDIVITAGSIEMGSVDLERGSLISAVTFGSGSGGDVDIRGGRLLVDGSNSNGGATISSLSDITGGGVGGQARLDLDELILKRGGAIFGDANGRSAASPGVEINSRDIRIDGAGEQLTGVFIRADSTGEAGGTVVLRAENIDVRNGGSISTTTDSDLDASDIVIVTDRLSVGGQGALFDTEIDSDTSIDAKGNAGNIEIVAETVDVSGDGSISSSTIGIGDAGRIDLIVGNSLRLRDEGSIRAGTAGESTGDAGSIAITTSELFLEDAAEIGSVTSGPGRAGSIDITADTALLDANGVEDFGGITTQGAPGSSGDAGDINLDIGELTLRDTSQIGSSAFGSGRAGTISIRSETIDIETIRGDGASITGISTAADVDGGDAGAIAIVADSLTLRGDDSEIQSTNAGPGAAGTIDIRLTEDLILGNGADILTSSASGGGGIITIVAGRSIATTGPDSVITTTVADDSGDAGDILIETPVLGLGDTRVIAQADAGSGGDIEIVVDDLLLSPDAFINAEAGATGIDGTVAVSAPEADLTGGLAAFDGRFLDVSSLLRERCAARRATEGSSFTLGTEGSLPADLDAPRLSLLGTSPGGQERRTILVLPCPKARS